MDDLTRKLLENLSPEDLKRIDALFGPEVRKKFDDAKAAQPTTVPVEQRRYFQIYSNGFDCVVDSRDANCEVEACRFALDPKNKQPWYSRETFIEPIDDLDVRTINHEQYIEWLRR